jgi:hypothetical protein
MELDLLWAALSGAALAAIADRLFTGILLSDRYNRHPEIWREGRSERDRILAALALSLLTAAAFVALASKIGQTDLRGGLKLAAMIWLIGPLPLLLANAMFIKIDPRIAAGHAAGWLAKLLLIGAATAWFLP